MRRDPSRESPPLDATHRTFRDQMGREVRVPSVPRRVVSLVPSQTELLFDLGVAHRLVGVTRFCVHPADGVASMARVGGTKQVSLEKLEALAPDLVIANKEENERTQIEAIAARWPVWLSDVSTLDDALGMIRGVGALVAAEPRAEALCRDIDGAFAALPRADGLRVAYLIWRRPWMGVGRGTFIDDLLQRCGFVNVLAEGGLDRYPELTPEMLREARPDLVLLSSEPFPFAEKHRPEVEAMAPQAAVRFVDGEAFSWYGSRLVRSAEVLGDLVRSVCGRDELSQLHRNERG